jgi:hypothetical protein
MTRTEDDFEEISGNPSGLIGSIVPISEFRRPCRRCWGREYEEWDFPVERRKIP